MSAPPFGSHDILRVIGEHGPCTGRQIIWALKKRYPHAPHGGIAGGNVYPSLANLTRQNRVTRTKTDGGPYTYSLPATAKGE